MERRLSIRKLIAHEVVLYCPGVGMLCCQVRDMSMDGVFLHIGQISIPTNTDVELAFNPREEDRDEYNGPIRFGGHVVRSHTAGVGVNFTTFHDGAFAYLKRLIAD